MKVTARGLTFDVVAGGPAGGAPVLLLHGFPQDSREWDAVVPRLHAAGLRTYGLDQRGYSPGARPAAVADYTVAEAAVDALAVLDELGVATAHVVGHDWGAQVAWVLAARHPERVRTLTALSVPHPAALAAGMRGWSQRLKLAYVPLFRSRLGERVLGRAVLRAMLRPTGRGELYADAMAGDPGRLTATLNWYRANGLDAALLPPVRVPTTYVWGTGDVVSRASVAATTRCVRADYRLVVLPGVGHWQPEEAPDAVAEAIVARAVDDV
ncbi:alpha/beta fold hydrolase [Spirilliplanes yamanashiensis]|uniref:Epoxide hydrolase n=1 Tax=Spirilliplanes yamanashiensis TaxID=42233 RepID=A0A8J3YE56_9ACTN|nr:alpha/beta hydrolase [Spirilliplanes yamanashiensis]MDP9816535.1 pimeloyl-ACP methyl ester carboxylesterase [Spirilliplanes yamanashiensis]GIJ06062.1 epoxide hydrolase [Spirilliplanes yamanashiensis]